METATNITETKITKEILADVIRIMKDNIAKFGGANNDAWKNSGNQVMEKYQLTEKGALLIMRAAISIVVGVIHPALA